MTASSGRQQQASRAGMNFASGLWCGEVAGTKAVCCRCGLSAKVKRGLVPSMRAATSIVLIGTYWNSLLNEVRYLKARHQVLAVGGLAI
ncbi:MAG: hypothetical protein EOS58_13860 [Mesorhizobium sp.]|uniref:hypothetical protein n=1 Tax=unclassified Mesorhizobium TaxID=325217 RepID=UPI000FC9B247|nr:MULTISPECIES: hypothetical protein [unclassified Mesorhizobium]RUX52243.1 hypothetical protein EOA33_03445 [Mesorhizobium sp. M4A.F.Ca.ET.050.02.1.1]RVC83820.1 hypothetical protein EN745_00795 [Mesorhizobium sp. M4A.F.Ca.ET.022.05.2.1]RWD04744.1 MAG: hypothetical protein EOS58_13860 [Mesorhizobium sp.]RWD16045.1 MAG: hypothetical protein EOS74_10520 [Mesorhizobium sp.]RWD36007.1 MAG: hypothetical protein EOS33_06230 [Mesorhizobium sp.]